MKRNSLSQVIKLSSLILIFLAVVVSFSGCATIMGGSAPANVSINSFPEHAKVKVTNSEGILVYEGITPTTILLNKYDGYFHGQTYIMTFSKKGYLQYITTDGMKVNGWSWYLEGNALFGGIIGWLIVDPLTGAMWNVNSRHINAVLVGSKSQ